MAHIYIVREYYGRHRNSLTELLYVTYHQLLLQICGVEIIVTRAKKQPLPVCTMMLVLYPLW